MASQGRLITIVDDSPEDRATVRRYLSQGRTDYRLSEYASPDDAVEACRQEAPDCMLLDYELAGTNGLEVLERLTEGTGVARFAIVILTGRGSESVAVQALKRGAVDYIVKGNYVPDQLRLTVADAMAKFAARPEAERQRAERERAHRAAGGTAPGRERLVLIVDDSPEDRMAARRALSQDGPAYRFLEEGTAAEGLKLSRSAGLDCLLLDYSLPDADGIEFLDELTGGTGITPFPVIMLTGRGDESVAVQALKHGAVDYLVKGRITSATLHATIDQAVERLASRRIQEEQRVQVLERLEAEARRRADQLTEADRRKDEFLAMLAHELRNPLAPIGNALHLLRRIASLPAPAGQVLDIADRQVKHLSRLVDDLMEVSRITRGKIKFKKEKVELAPIISRAIDVVNSVIEARRHELVMNLPVAPIFLDGDPTRLEQIFANLLNNAAKYTDPGGRIEVNVIPMGIEAEVRVKDNGIGIDPGTLPHVFDLFAQADRSLDRSQGGLGIGLTLVRSLADQHGGSVKVASQGPGLGSEFTVTLPILEMEPPPNENQSAEFRNGDGLKVLVVDDNVDGAEMLAMLFRSSGHEVRTTHDGPSGLEAALTSWPDAVFLDIGLPHMSGYEVAREIRSKLGNESPVLVAFTGYGHDEDLVRSKEAGFEYHLVKPVPPDELLRVIAGIGQQGSLSNVDDNAIAGRFGSPPLEAADSV